MCPACDLISKLQFFYLKYTMHVQMSNQPSLIVLLVNTACSEDKWSCWLVQYHLSINKYQRDHIIFLFQKKMYTHFHQYIERVERDFPKKREKLHTKADNIH